MIPQAVLNEIESEPAKTKVRNADWIKVFEVPKEKDRSLFSSKLHFGEIKVILLAQKVGADLLLMDDNAAKKISPHLVA